MYASRPKVLKGTTTVGLTFRDGVVLAADKRATVGYYIAHKQVKKIARLADRIAMTISGVVADAQAIADTLRAEIKYYHMYTGRPMSVKSVATIASTIVFAYRTLPLVVQLIIAGYDTAPRIFTVDWFGTITEERYVATGSGSPIATGLIEAEYRDAMSADEAISLAVRAINSALKRDSATGEGIDVVVITRDSYVELGPAEVSKILKRA